MAHRNKFGVPSQNSKIFILSITLSERLPAGTVLH